MQKLLLALFGASLCVLATAQYGKYGRSYGDSYGGSNLMGLYGGNDKTREIKHIWQQKDYKNDGYGKSDDYGYGGYKNNDYGYGKQQEGYSSAYFVMENNQKGYGRSYEEPKKYQMIYRNDDRMDNYKKYNSYRMDDKYEPKKYEIKYDDYSLGMNDNNKYEISYNNRYDDKSYMVNSQMNKDGWYGGY